MLLLPTFTALAAATLAAPVAGLPTVLMVLMGLLVVQAIGGAGPANDAVLLLLRGRWLPDALPAARWVPSLGVGATAMILAMLLRRRLRP